MIQGLYVLAIVLGLLSIANSERFAIKTVLGVVAVMIVILTLIARLL